MNSTKKTFLTSLMALLLCVVMLMGTTFAWFTDVVTSTGNIIQAGNLDAEMYYSETLENHDWKNADGPAVFNYDKWEPGYTSVRYIKVKNAGKLNFKFQLSLDANGVVSKLGDVIDVYFFNPATEEITTLDGLTKVDNLTNVIKNNNNLPGTLAPGAEVILAIALHMQESAGNEYQKLELCEGGFDLKLIATQVGVESDSFGPDYDDGATWEDTLPEQSTASSAMELNEDGTLPNALTFANDDGTISITVPAGTKFKQGTKLANLNVNKLATSGANITLEENEETRSFDVHVANLDESNTKVISIAIKEFLPAGLNMGNYHLYHVEDGQTVEMQLLADGETPVHNSFNYDPATGDVVLHLASFSEVALVADTENAWEGNFDYSWYDASKTELTIANADQLAAFGAIVGGMKKVTGRNDDGTYTYSDDVIQDSFAGKTVKLISDINLGDDEEHNVGNKIFYPIGYWNNEGTYERLPAEDRVTAVSSGFYNFSGTFDGNGHTIANFYQNTWEMKGDHNWYDPIKEQYYRDGMGLFGKIYGGTVKNLTVKNFSSDGEIATTGVIAAYADGATFENIAIFNCNPRVYNIGNGGIVGCVGWYAKEADLKTTFKNVTVDNSNKISALWGSYDVACGGIVGQYYPTSGQTSAGTPKNAGLYFENCHVAAQMDVYNDVCANYQYYAYRYTGMLIGSVRENVTIDGHSYPKMDGITAKDCTVHFGTWNDYYYCEFEKNSMASYSEDYQFSRIPHSEINFTDSNDNGIIDTDEERASVTGCTHTHTPEEDKQCVYLPFNNLVTGYGWGVTSKGVGDLAGVTILDREVGNSVEKFEGKVNKLTTDRVYTIDEIFAYIENCGVKIVDGAVNVTITNLDENGNVKATFKRGEKWNEGTISFENAGNIAITIQDYYFCEATTITVNVTKRVAEEKFDIVMNNGDFLHRVGNSGTVALDKLFKAKDGATIGEVSVTIEAMNATAASGTYTANNTWANGTIQFSGTGIVKVTIKDDDTYCIPTELLLEVVDAYNATSAQSTVVKDASGNITFANNVVLLNDIFGGFTVSDGYAFYGNGFKVTCSGKGTYLNNGGMTLGYVNVQTGGILDNVRVICDIFPNAFVYAEEVKVSSNLDKEASTSDRSRYMYQLSAIAVSGDGSVVANCYAYGGRNNIFVGGGNVTIENTVTECGTLANIQIAGIKDTAVNTVILKDVTTIQYKNASTYDSTKIMLGFGIMVGDNESTDNPTIILQGDLKQYNWVTSEDTSVSNTYAKTAIEGALAVTTYCHTINGKTAVNMGIAYLNANTTTFPAGNDQRTNKQEIPYHMAPVNISGKTGYVYSISGSAINESNRYNAEYDGVTPYKPNAQRDIVPKPTFSLGNQTVTGEDRYLTGDINGITARYESGQEAFTLDITKLMTANKYGSTCTVNAICIDPDGNTLNGIVTLNKSGVYTLKFTVVDTIFYYLEGEEVVKVDKTIEYTYTVSIKLTIAEPSVPDATLTVDTSKTYEGEYTDSTADGSKKLSINPLNAITVTDAGQPFTLTSNVKSVDITYSATGTDGNGNAFGGTTTITITYNDGQVLKIVLAKPTSNSPGNPKSITYDSSSGTVKSSNTLAKKSCTAATWAVTSYSFTGKNGKTVTAAGVTFSIAANTSGGCVTGDTLVTLADGTQKRIDALDGTEMLLVWDFYKGEYTVSPVGAIVNHGYDMVNEVTMSFANGSSIKTLRGHGFYDVAENKFVIIDENNIEEYLGHEFVVYDSCGNANTTVLVDYSVESKYHEIWTIVSAVHFNCVLNGMLTLSPTDFPNSPAYLMPFEIGEGMKYDEEKMQADIEKYGQYTYEDFAEYCTYEQFVGLNFANWKVAVGKGYITYEEIIYLIETYVN